MQDYDSSAKSYLAQNLNVIMSIWKLNQHEFAALIGTKYPAFNNYMNLRSFPQVPTLMTITDVTNVPTHTRHTEALARYSTPGSSSGSMPARRCPSSAGDNAGLFSIT